MEDVDILIGNDKLFDHAFLDEFKDNLKMLERIVMAPQMALNDIH